MTPTHYVHCNGAALSVKEASFFESQGGLTASWGKAWRPVAASGIEAARELASALFTFPLSPIHNEARGLEGLPLIKELP